MYVANDYITETNALFINNQGKGFTEQAAVYGLNHSQDDMGIAVGDYNNDGSFDFYITAIRSNAFYENKKNNVFEDKAVAVNVYNTGWAWDVRFSDFDLDRDEYLFVLNGYKYGNSRTQNNVYYEN